MDIKTIDICICGTTPLLMHRFTDEAQMSATTSIRANFVGETGDVFEEAAKSLYLDESGTIIIPGPSMFRCLIDAGKFFKVGRSKVTTQKSSLIPAAVAMQDLVIPLRSKDDSDPTWKVDTRPVRIPATGGRILRHRPCFDSWSLRFTLALEAEDVISIKMLRSIVDAAGTRIGLGDFRPDCKGPFGRFVVTNWKERATA